MHLLPLLSAIVALCLTRLTVGLPQQQQQQEREQGQREREQQQPVQATDNSHGDLLQGLGGVAVAGWAYWQLMKLKQKHSNDFEKSQNVRQPKRAPQDPAAVKKTVLSNPLMKWCMFNQLGKYVPGANGKYTPSMKVSVRDWNLAAENCRLNLWTEEILLLDDSGEITFDLMDDPSTPAADEDPPKPLEFRVNDLREGAITTLHGNIVYAFGGQGPKPAGSGRYVGQGVGLPRARPGM